MLLRFFIFLMSLSAAYAAQDAARLRMRSVSTGLIALCRPTIMDEWQIVGDPRKLSSLEASKLGALLAADETWYERQPDGSFRASKTFSCDEPGDFKIVLFDSEANVFAAIRVWVDCRSVDMRIDGTRVELPGIREPARTEMVKLFDKLFPDWRSVSAENKRRWKDEIQKLHR